MSVCFNKHVVKALADVAIFLEFTDENLLNQDIAIQMMEQMAAELRFMDQNEKLSLSKTFNELSNEFTDPLHKTFVKNLSDSLGIND